MIEDGERVKVVVVMVLSWIKRHGQWPTTKYV